MYLHAAYIYAAQLSLRKEGDSNPWAPVRGPPAFETGALSRSAILPFFSSALG